jgi:hypothetical protein
MKESAPATHICQVCKKPKSPHEGQIAELIRPSLLEFIKKLTPGWDGKASSVSTISANSEKTT